MISTPTTALSGNDSTKLATQAVAKANGRSLAMIVDITGTTPYYDASLAKALADYPEVEFRTCPNFADPGIFRNSFLKTDLLGTAAWLVERWPAMFRTRRLWKLIQLHGYVSAWRKILHDLKRRGTPVLHLQWCKLPLLDYWFMRRAQKQGVRVVYTIHNALPHNERGARARRIYRKLYRQADALVVLSRFVGQQVTDWVDDSLAKKIHVIEHGVLELASPMPSREAARIELNLEPDAEVILFMGRIDAYKGITDLIDALSVARRDRPKLRLVIAGNPTESFAGYQSRIDRLGLTEIVRAYPRYVSEDFKSALYAAADVAVLPHRDPSQSAMGLEALAAGKPLIVTRGGGLVELVDEEINGYIVPPGDPSSLGRALGCFFEKPLAVQQSMAEASRAIGHQRFAWPAIARKHIELFRSLAE